MTQLTKDTPRAFELGSINELPVAASSVIYEGSAAGVAASTGTVARQLVATDRFVGFAERKADNSAGAAGDVTVRLRTFGLAELDVTGADNTKVQSVVYASDGNTFTLTSTGNSKIGFIRRHISGTRCLVYFDADMAN